MHFQIGALKKGINPLSCGDFVLNSPYFPVALKTGIITGVIAMAVSFYMSTFYFFFLIKIQQQIKKKSISQIKIRRVHIITLLSN